MGGLGDLLKGADGGGGGGLGDLLGGILGGGSAGGGSASLGGNPMLRMLLPLVASLLMNGGLQKILGTAPAERRRRDRSVVGLEGTERARRRGRHQGCAR